MINHWIVQYISHPDVAFGSSFFFFNKPTIYIEENLLQYPLPIIKKAWELGLMNGHIPQEYGKRFSGLLSDR